jgi:Predicted transcriptional regulators
MGKRENVYRIGSRVKKRRKEKGLTIKSLAEYTGLSVGYLSNLENDMNSPTLENLFIICEALDYKVSDMIMDETPGKTVIRKSEWKNYEYPQYNQHIGVIDFQHDNQIYEIITIKPGNLDDTPSCRHKYCETCTVLKGVLTVKLEGTVYRLEQGDSIYIPEKQKHVIYNEADETCISYWVYQRK